MGSQRTRRRHWRRPLKTSTGALYICFSKSASSFAHCFLCVLINLLNFCVVFFCGLQKKEGAETYLEVHHGGIYVLFYHQHDQCMSQCRLGDFCVYTGLDYSPLLLSRSNILPLSQLCVSLGGSTHLSCPTGPFFHCLYLMTALTGSAVIFFPPVQQDGALL